MKTLSLLAALIAFFAASQAQALGNGCYKFNVNTHRNGGGVVTYFLWIGNGTYKVEAGNLQNLSLATDNLCGSRLGDYASTSYNAYCQHLARRGERCDLE